MSDLECVKMFATFVSFQSSKWKRNGDKSRSVALTRRRYARMDCHLNSNAPNFVRNKWLRVKRWTDFRSNWAYAVTVAHGIYAPVWFAIPWSSCPAPAAYWCWIWRWPYSDRSHWTDCGRATVFPDYPNDRIHPDSVHADRCRLNSTISAVSSVDTHANRNDLRIFPFAVLDWSAYYRINRGVPALLNCRMRAVQCDGFYSHETISIEWPSYLEISSTLQCHSSRICREWNKHQMSDEKRREKKKRNSTQIKPCCFSISFVKIKKSNKNRIEPYSSLVMAADVLAFIVAQSFVSNVLNRFSALQSINDSLVLHLHVSQIYICQTKNKKTTRSKNPLDLKTDDK